MSNFQSLVTKQLSMIMASLNQQEQNHQPVFNNPTSIIAKDKNSSKQGRFKDACNIDSFCLQRTRLIIQQRHLVVTFSVEEFSSISQIKSFLLQCIELVQLKLDTNLHYLTASNYLVRSKFEKPWLLRVQLRCLCQL